MNLKNLIPRKGKLKEGCRFDKQSGIFECESRRVLEDGTEVDLGRVSGSVTADCNIAPDEVWEVESGVIDRLDKKFVQNIKGKCRAKPQDY